MCKKEEEEEVSVPLLLVVKQEEEIAPPFARWRTINRRPQMRREVSFPSQFLMPTSRHWAEDLTDPQSHKT